MGPTLAQLETFYWIARLGSFHAAAHHLHLSQPTVSARIRVLEQVLGQPLFERAGRGVRVTNIGDGLFERAGRLLTLAKDITSEKLELDPMQTGLRLGAPDSFALVCLPFLLQLLKRGYPELKMALMVENSLILNQRLEDGDLDIAFLAEPQLRRGLHTELLGRMELRWFASPQLKLPNRPLRAIEIAQHQIFTNPAPSQLIVYVREWFGRVGIELPRISTCNSLSVIVGLTVAGAGVSLLPTAIVRRELSLRSLRRLTIQPAMTSPRFFAAYRASESGPGISTVVAAARKVIARTKFLAN